MKESARALLAPKDISLGPVGTPLYPQKPHHRFLRSGRLAVACSIAFLGLALPSFGQLTSGDLVGTVLDAAGAAVPNATVDATNVGTNVKTSHSTNASGEYRFTNLPVGTYNLLVAANGFAQASLKDVAIQLNKTVTANVTLSVGQVATTVDVTEASPTIDTTTAQIQSSYDEKLSRDLPLASIGQGVLNLSLLSAGISSGGGVGSGTGPAIAGQRPRNNSFTIEGVDNNDKDLTGPLLFLPNDTVSEFTVLQNQFSPEFGHSSGGQFNTNVKSGTNQFHGMIYDYLQNRNLNGVDQSNANQGIRSNPRYDQNRLGGLIGGPIVRNKLFFFSAFEYNPLGQASNPSSAVMAPTASGYAALANVPGLSQTNLSVLKQYAVAPSASDVTPVSTPTGMINVPIGVLPLVSPNFTNGYYNVNSVDYNLSQKDQMRGRFIYNKLSAIDSTAELPVFFTTQPNTYFLGTFSEYHNFTPNLTNELRLGYNRFNQTYSVTSATFPGFNLFPNIQVDEFNLQLGPDTNAPQFRIQNTYQITDNVSWIHGAHSFKFGFDGRKLIAPSSFTQRSRGDYEWSTLDGYLHDYTPDDLSQRSLGNPIFYGDQISTNLYANDTWRIRKNLSLNLGLRWEFISVPYSERSQIINNYASVPGVLSFIKPEPQYKNFAPRVGFAYSPGTSGNTSIRAGFGMNYDVIFDNIGVLSLPPQLSTTVDNTNNSGDMTPGFLKSGGIRDNTSTGTLSAANARAATAGYIPNQKLPYSIQWNFGVQHVFAKNYTFEARYLATRGVHLDVQTRINKLSIVTPTHSLPTYLTAPSQDQLNALPLTLAQLQGEAKATGSFVPSFKAAGFTSPIVEDSPIGNSSYHGLALQLNRRFSNNLLFIAAYTWSHAIDDSTADFFSTVLTPRRPQDFQHFSQEKATSAIDRRQRLTLTAVYDLPVFKGSNHWIAKNVLGNWEIAPIYTYESPELATVQSAVDSTLNGDTYTARSIINLNGTGNTSTDVTALKNSAGATVAYLAKDPSAHYIRAAAGAYPNGGRNTIPVRPIDNIDMTFVKRFSFTERTKLEFQGQFLNLFNHPQYIGGFLDRIDNSNTALVTVLTGSGTRNFLTPGNKLFNRPDLTFPSNARTIQVVAKFTF